MTILFDLETDNLLLDCNVIHCGYCYIVEDGTYLGFTSRPIKGSSGSIEDMIELLKTADVLVAHNGIKFDIPVIKKLYNVNLWEHCEIQDTLIMSQLGYPNMLMIDSNNRKLPPKMKGSHSLASWGYRLGLLKGTYGEQEDAWLELNDNMFSYCRRDVEVTYDLYKKLVAKDIPSEALWLEYNFARIIARQEQYGVYFDVKKAQTLHIELMKDKEKATTELHKVFTPLFLPKGKLKTQKDYVKKFPFKAQGKTIIGSHQPIIYTEFNPSSRQHIAIWFKRWYDWESPKETDKGNPIINDAILKDMDYPEASILAHYFEVNKLLGQLAEGDNAWLKMVRDDNRIHGQVNTLGAVSRRCTHSNPNMAQVPSSRAFRGGECRALFTVPKGKKLVGCDADGLELRTLSHYMARYDKGRYAKTVDEGNKDNGTDIHTVNQKSAGLPTRDDAKTFILTQVII